MATKINPLGVAFWLFIAGIIAVIAIWYFKYPEFLYNPIVQYIATPLGNAWAGIQANPTDISSYIVPAASVGASGIAVYKFIGERATKENALAETLAVKEDASAQIKEQKEQYTKQISDLQTQLNEAKNSKSKSVADVQLEKQKAEIEAATQKRIAEAALQKLADGPKEKIVYAIK